MNIGGGAGAVLSTTSGIANLASSLSSRLGGAAQSYFDQLRPASFRGVSFVSLGGESSFGRRKQLHEYPQRDVPWVEDLGRGTRRIRMYAFVIGDDVISQRDTLIAACETSGDGDLIHPSLGKRTVSLMDFRSIERWDAGRYFEFQFEFIEGGPRTYPTAATATTQGVTNASTVLNLAAAASFAKQALGAVEYGAAIVGIVVSASLGWYTYAKNIVGDARNLFQLLFNLPGDFGRFGGSATVPTFSQYPSSSVSSSATTESLIKAATAARAAVDTASATLAAAAANLGSTTVDAYTSAVQGVVTAVLGATNDPDDSIRLLTTLSTYAPSTQTTSSTIGTAMGDMQVACGDLFRRTTIASIASASSTYQPTSSDDAVRVRDLLTGLIDAEMTVAGDEGDDDTYEALSALREAVVADLNQRGAGLAAIKAFTFAAPMNALALATRLYRDPTRADELIAQANPVHPAFMPTSFKALAD